MEGAHADVESEGEEDAPVPWSVKPKPPVPPRSQTQKLTPEKMKRLGLPEGIDLRNTDV